MADPIWQSAESIWRQRALIFNMQPVTYLHDSWCDRLPHGALLRRLRGVPRARAALSRHLLTELDLLGRYVEDFASPWARLALLDGPWIERLLRRLGLALSAPLLWRELSGEQVRRFKATLSAEDWLFATRETPLLGQIPPFEFAASATDVDTATDFGQIGAQFCARHGLGVLDRALTQRLALKLPAAWAPALVTDVQWRATAATPPATELPPLLQKLLRERPTAWNPLFA